MRKTIRQIPFAVIVLLLLFNGCKNAPDIEITTSLPRSVPEAEGVSSGGILAFLDAAAESPHEFHSLMIVRHGKVIAEGWWAPYDSSLKHTLYSTSKSFTSTAVGFTVSDSLLTVNDKVVSFFPEYLPDSINPYLADLEVKDLLTMSVGQDPEPTGLIRGSDTNWVKSFLAAPVVNAPGTKFLYNSMATYMLSAIVQKVTGEKVIDYLTPRLFEPLGIEGMDWEVDPMGINTGGWGLRVKTEDMAKFGQLYLQKGSWNGRQLLPASWIEEATSAKIDQAPDAPQTVKDSSDWMQGYCYQFWRCRNNAFRADGAYGQYIIVLPEKDAVIAITSETQNMQEEINLVWKYILPALKDEQLPENNIAAENLKHRLASLALPLPANIVDSTRVSDITGKTFTIKPNESNIDALSFHFMENMCHVTLKTGETDYNLTFGSGHWIKGETTRLGPNLLGSAKAHFDGLPASKIAGSYNWSNSNTLVLKLRYIESPHTETFICSFDKNKIMVDIQFSNAPDRKMPSLIGELR